MCAETEKNPTVYLVTTEMTAHGSEETVDDACFCDTKDTRTGVYMMNAIQIITKKK